MPLHPAQRALRAQATLARAKVMAGYFKTGRGEYAEGDRFLGVSVPDTRRVARDFRSLDLPDVRRLLLSKVHEDRLLGLFILVEQARRADADGIARIAAFYLAHLDRVNNWDLVDSSAPQILGPYLQARGSARLLDRLARSRNLWRRRVAMIATRHFIRNGDVRPALRIATALVDDEHDLIHKAVGWMLREVGDRDPAALRGFLARHAARMPRTMVRYAIEKMTSAERRRTMDMR
ncbi:MAG: DNA alkylation repair protein [Methanobacteriota archaeon]